MQKIVVDKEASPYAPYDHPFPTGEQEVKDIATWFSQHDDFLAVCETASKEVIGYIAMHAEKPKEFNLGYCFHSAYQNKGYATEACIAVVNYAFETLKANRLISGTAVLNLPSCTLLAKLGFRKTGEGITSLQKTAEGKAIEFVGASFESIKDTWLQTDYSNLDRPR